MTNHQITKEQLIETLEKHLKKIDKDEAVFTMVYKNHIKTLIYKLKNGGYEEETLPRELSSLGFQDLAQEIRWGFAK